MLAGISPVILGTSMVLSPAGTSAAIARRLSSARLDPSDEHRLGVIYTGLYVLWLGVLLLLAGWDPVGQRDFIRVAGLLLVMRGLQRYFRSGELAAAYGVMNGKNWLHITWLCGIGLTLIGLSGYAPPVPAPAFKIVHALRQMVLGMVTLHGVVVGAALAIWPGFALQICALLSGAKKIPASAQFHYIVQPLGIYMIAFGLLAGCAQTPGSIPRLSGALGLLLIVRGLARWPTADMLKFAFGIPRRTLAIQAAWLIAAGLIVALGPIRP